MNWDLFFVFKLELMVHEMVHKMVLKILKTSMSMEFHFVFKGWLTVNVFSVSVFIYFHLYVVRSIFLLLLLASPLLVILQNNIHTRGKNRNRYLWSVKVSVL
jgi:hypothetical protein